MLAEFFRKTFLSKRATTKQLKLLYLVAFFFGSGNALVTYINSSFLKGFIDEGHVGYVYSISYFITIIFLYYFVLFVKKLGKKYSLVLLLFIKIILLINLAYTEVQIVALVTFVLFMITGWLTLTNFNILVESFTKDEVTGQVKAYQYVLENLGWVLLPTASGFIAGYFGFSYVFLLAAVIYFAMILMVLFWVKKENYEFRPQMSIKELYLTIKERKNILVVFFSMVMLNLFFSTMVIYTPIYLLGLGLEWTQIGLIISVTLLPYVLFQFPAGYLADRVLGEKEMLILGFMILSISTVAIFFVNSVSVLVWMLVLFITRIGASLIQINSDAYFYKKISARQINLIDFYHNARPVGYFVGPLLASLLLMFVDLRFIFLILGIVLLGGVFIVLPLRDTK